MQRLVYFCTGTSRFFQVVGVNHLKNGRLLFEKENSFSNTNSLIFKRCLAIKNNDSKKSKNIDVHADLYKPSTAKEETHVTDELKGHQSPETFNTAVKATKLGGGKVWSPKSPDEVHVAPLGRDKSTTFVPKSTDDGLKFETTVYTTRGQLNIADPFKTRTLQPEVTSAKLAEAAAASAFEPFAPATPSTSTPVAEAVFSPKISSNETYSTTSSPTSHFVTDVPPSSSQNESVKYEATNRPKVFGGQDTSAETKKRLKDNPFNENKKGKPKQSK